jgi:hypothetical protein
MRARWIFLLASRCTSRIFWTGALIVIIIFIHLFLTPQLHHILSHSTSSCPLLPFARRWSGRSDWKTIPVLNIWYDRMRLSYALERHMFRLGATRPKSKIPRSSLNLIGQVVLACRSVSMRPSEHCNLDFHGGVRLRGWIRGLITFVLLELPFNVL